MDKFTGQYYVNTGCNVREVDASLYSAPISLM